MTIADRLVSSVDEVNVNDDVLIVKTYVEDSLIVTVQGVVTKKIVDANGNIRLYFGPELWSESEFGDIEPYRRRGFGVDTKIYLRGRNVRHTPEPAHGGKRVRVKYEDGAVFSYAGVVSENELAWMIYEAQVDLAPWEKPPPVGELFKWKDIMASAVDLEWL